MGAGGRYKLRIHGVGRAGTSTVFPQAVFALCDEEGPPLWKRASIPFVSGASQPDSRSVKLMGQAPAKRKVCQIQKAILDL